MEKYMSEIHTKLVKYYLDIDTVKYLRKLPFDVKLLIGGDFAGGLQRFTLNSKNCIPIVYRPWMEKIILK